MLGILLEVHRKTISNKTDLNLAELMSTLTTRCNPRGEIYWEDEFDYGGALEFQGEFRGEKWNPFPGFEYLVADPAEIDFSPAISLATNPQPHASSASNTQPQPILTSSNCFAKLPREVQLLILEILPSKSISKEKKPIRYNVLLNELKKASLVKEPDVSQDLSPFQILGLENRRCIWLNCEFILGKVKEEFSTLWQQAGSVSPIIRKISTYLSTPIKDPEDIENKYASDVYSVPDVVIPYSLKNIVAYFGDEKQIIGVEFLVDGLVGGEDSCQLFGNRSSSKESVVVARVDPGAGDYVRGTLPCEPRYTLGKWSEDSVVQVLHAELDHEVIGITGQFNSHSILTFGFIIADLTREMPGTAPLIYNYPEYCTRWIGHWPPAQYNIHPRYGSPSQERCLETPVFFLDLLGKQICRVQAYFPHGEKGEFGGFTFSFDDRTEVLAGDSSSKITSSSSGGGDNSSIIHFNVDEKEQITGVHLHFANKDPVPSKLCGLQFKTSSPRTLSLGYVEVASNEHGERLLHVEPFYGHRRIGGLQFGLRPPVVENMGLVLADVDEI
ncbi:hypothetical protein VTN00DRAFT_9431 [Thermoascus crustaceus]|uniref:uncharacterized protein n=1 Tax=Thermoascus crustaceus TaxID=5088 RepID=UPI003743EC5C